MDAILTHENADFDALGALLGAKKIYPTALAILPRRMNRNVREFCALYCDVLPFTRPDDLPRQRFRQIVVVDSQAVQSARGVTPQTRIHFIDHHPLTRDLKPTMTFSGGETGATTTLFVEQIREKELALTPIEATLLLLGIYEDTGSLSYITTTSRDLRAAAFLLEHGASLAIVNEFLHPPLTDTQHKLYQQLIEKIQIREMAGHPIAIAAARADTYVEEISVLAHQLREMYDPAALFLLVQMDDHIQLVARSERAEIDVAKIATAFGGGGHDKAAAALIRGLTLRQVKTRLVKLLKEHVQPSLTVRDVMSFGVHTFDATTTVAQAAEAMNRYGHEGFPVLQRGKLVGIVTRREIDRAVRHKLLNTPIKNLMQKPASVSPDDTLEKVRAVMIENNLGQVPVVQDQRIIGIVTRTDLIKPWNKQPTTRAQEIAARLEKWLPPELLALLRDASHIARDLGYRLYIVGGFVRDLLLNQPTLDLDLVVEGDAVKLAQALQQKYGGRVHAHARFGTAKWILKETKDEGRKTKEIPLAPQLVPITAHLASLDFSTARTEFYAHPSALPEVETSSIKQDLHRRDFTINTLAICLDPERYGQLLDPFGGEGDLQRGIIRVLHNLSFIEDPTRILRAARFEQRFGFKIEPRTAQLISDALGMFARVSGERIRHEFNLIFRENEPEKAFARAHALGALTAIYPALDFTDWHARKFAQARETYARPSELMYLGLLAYRLTLAQIKEFSERLRLPNADIETLAQLVALREQAESQLATEEMSPSAIYRSLEGYSDAALDIFAIATDDERVRARVTLFRTELRYVTPEMTGNDLKRMGLRPGPVYRDILARLRAARLDGEITTREEEEALVRQMINEMRE
ncbi:MAG: CBS domain-containing protein [Anaerolineae bacterium]|nr:CBS domain-containing protein [Anaerolineae bacterium]